MHGYKIIGISSNEEEILHFFVPNWDLVVEFVKALAGEDQDYGDKLKQMRQRLGKFGGVAYLLKDGENVFMIEDVSRVTSSKIVANQLVSVEFQKDFMKKLNREQLAWKVARTLNRSQEFYKDWSVEDLQQRLDSYYQVECQPDFMKSASKPVAKKPETKPVTKKPEPESEEEEELPKESEEEEETKPNKLTDELVVKAVFETRKKDLASLVAIKKWLRENVNHESIKDFDQLVLKHTKSCVGKGLLSQVKSSFSIKHSPKPE